MGQCTHTYNGKSRKNDKRGKQDHDCLDPVTHPWISRWIAAGFLIWKILSDLKIIFYIRILIRNIPIVLVASDMDAIGSQALYGEIKLLDFSVKGLWMLGVINIHN